MKLYVADISDNASDLPGWLESHLVGPHLGELVAELTAIHRPGSGPSDTLADALGKHRDAVLERGLSVLKPARLSRLMINPHLLLQLQELVCVEGGPYWTSVRPQDDMLLEAQVERGRLALDLTSGGTATATIRPATRPATTAPARFVWGWAALATAAAVALAVYLGQPPAPKWGWNGPNVLTAQVNGPEYLNRLADAAEQWQLQPRDGKRQLAQRLTELKQGCDRLLGANHAQLAPADREWLVAKCKDWAGKIDDLRAALQRGDDPDAVRKAADETVGRFAKALRDQATKAS